MYSFHKLITIKAKCVLVLGALNLIPVFDRSILHVSLIGQRQR